MSMVHERRFRPCLESLEARVQLSSGLTTAAPSMAVVSAEIPAAALDHASVKLAAPTPAQQARQVFQAANLFRAQHHLAPLRTNAILQRVAQAHTANMARQQTLSHVLNGLNPAQRVTRAGYIFSVVAENIAFSTNLNVNAIMRGWFNSPGHRHNLLLSSVVDTGIGVAQSKAGNWYYTQVFAAPLSQPV
jgi:uncharacterized protein YkwD